MRRFVWAFLGLLSVATIAVGAAVGDASATTDGGFVRSYAADSTVRQGMIVALKSGDTGKVEPLTSTNISDMLGVAISPSDAPITLVGDASSQVYVATSGQYDVLVSTENGAIHAGDYISISTLNGIGMKAQDNQPTVLGRAAADFTNAGILERSVAIHAASGQEVVAIGVVPVGITVTANPNAGFGSGNLPGFLRIASNTIANKPVAAPRVYLALAALLLAAFISGVILYSAVRGGITSIGRNPLARRSILGGLYQAILAGVVIFIIGLFAVYLLLRL